MVNLTFQSLQTTFQEGGLQNRGLLRRIFFCTALASIAPAVLLGHFNSTTSSPIVQTVRSNGGAGFLAGTPVSVAPAVPTSVVLGDFNGDGKADIALPGGQLGPSTVTIALGKGDGTFQPPAHEVGQTIAFCRLSNRGVCLNA